VEAFDQHRFDDHDIKNSGLERALEDLLSGSDILLRFSIGFRAQPRTKPPPECGADEPHCLFVANVSLLERPVAVAGGPISPSK
jgi:hypothetical protein